jgi:hypothetical protein
MQISKGLFSWNAQLDHSPDYVFINAGLTVDKSRLGNEDPWEVASGFVGSVKDMLKSLMRQRNLLDAQLTFVHSLQERECFDALDDWAWGSGSWAYEEQCSLQGHGMLATDFVAIPIGVNTFDGDRFFVLTESPTSPARGLIKSFGGNAVVAVNFSFDEYLTITSDFIASIELSSTERNKPS